MDVVPRLWYALSKNKESNILYIIIAKEGMTYKLEKNFLEFLKLLGIEKQVYILSKATRFKKVIVPQKSYDFDLSIKENNKFHYYSNEYLKTFDYVVKKALNKKGYIIKNKKRKIYLMRKHEGDAGIEMINNLFQNNGFEMVDPLEISLSELILKLRNCEIVAYITGTLQHNLMFAPEGIKAIAIERRAVVSPIQVDIDMIKNVQVDYIDAHYSIVPDENYYDGLYGYTEELKKYIEKADLNYPNIYYTTEEYCKTTIKEYMKKYRMLGFGKTMIEFDEYIFKDYQESMKKLEKFFKMPVLIDKEDFFNIEKAQQKIKEMLIDLRLCYAEWQDNSWLTIHNFFSRLIHNILKRTKPDKFLIYPFGKNGMLLKQILIEQYGIEEVIAFDNQLSKINPSIKSLCEIKNYYTYNSCIVLTSAIKECWEEISLYVNLTDIEGPFSVIE